MKTVTRLEFIEGKTVETVNEPRCEKTGLRDFRLGPTQTRLYNHTRFLEDLKFAFMKKKDCTSETEGADHLHSYCAADLRLCFRICKKPVFS